MDKPRVFADFHNADARGRVRLNCIGTIEDLARQQVALRPGMQLTLLGDELEVEGAVEYSTEEGLWVAVIDWDVIQGEQAVKPEASEQPDKSAA